MAFSAFPATAETERTISSDFFGETVARRTAERYLSDRGIKFERRPLLAERGGFGVSLHTDISTSSVSSGSGVLVIAVPLSSTKTASGMEPDFAVRAALAFAGRVAAEGAPMDVRVALLADERSQLPKDLRGETLLGLRDLADRYEETERTAIVYLDLRELGGDIHGDLRIAHGSAGTVAPLGILEPLLSAFNKLDSPLSVAVPFNELYRMGLVAGRQELGFLHERGFPALLIEAGSRRGRSNHSAPLTAERFADGLYDYAVALGSIPEATDRRYYLFSIGRRIVPLPEGLSVTLFALTAAIGMAVVLSYSLTHRHLLIARGRVFLRRSWALPLFLAVLFFCILTAGAVISFFIRAAGADEEKARYGAAALKFALALALYSIASPLFTLRPVPRRAHFYSSAACFLFAGGSFFAAMIDFTFVPIFLWAFACALVSSVIHSPSAAFALACLAPLQILSAAAAAIGSGDDGAARILLSGGVRIDLFLAFATLPFLLLFRRAAALSRSRAGPSQRLRARYSRGLFFVGTLLTVLSYARDAGAAERATVAPVRERMEAANVFGSPLRLEVKSWTFLDRRTLKVTIRPEGRPVRLDLSFESDENVSIYDAPVPWILSADAKRATLSLGERPAVPLDLELTLPLSAKGTLRAAALYIEPLNRDAESETRHDYALIVDASTKIGNVN